MSCAAIIEAVADTGNAKLPTSGSRARPCACRTGQGVTEAMLKMGKIDVAGLEAAARG
jgi:hypothetical protein